MPDTHQKHGQDQQQSGEESSAETSTELSAQTTSEGAEVEAEDSPEIRVTAEAGPKPGEYRLGLEKVEEMFAAYSERPTASHVAQRAAVHWVTAKRYIEKGDPARGILPFKKRALRVNRFVQQRTEETVAYEKSEAIASAIGHIEAFDEIVAKLVSVYSRQLRKLGKKGAKGSVALADVANALRTSISLKVLLLGKHVKTTGQLSGDLGSFDSLGGFSPSLLSQDREEEAYSPDTSFDAHRHAPVELLAPPMQSPLQSLNVEPSPNQNDPVSAISTPESNPGQSLKTGSWSENSEHAEQQIPGSGKTLAQVFADEEQALEERSSRRYRQTVKPAQQVPALPSNAQDGHQSSTSQDPPLLLSLDSDSQPALNREASEQQNARASSEEQPQPMSEEQQQQQKTGEERLQTSSEHSEQSLQTSSKDTHQTSGRVGGDERRAEAHHSIDRAGPVSSAESVPSSASKRPRKLAQTNAAALRPVAASAAERVDDDASAYDVELERVADEIEKQLQRDAGFPVLMKRKSPRVER